MLYEGSIFNMPVLSLEILVLFLALTVMANMIVFMVNSRLLRVMKSKKHEKDRVIAEQQVEIEKQNRLINNITNLYNDVIEYDRMKTDFFANICHDLKTPLSVILGAIQLMDYKMDILTYEQKKSGRHLATIKQNSYRLIRLINNILDIARLDSGYIKINMVNCNIVYLVEEITHSVVLYAEQKGLTIEFDTEDEEILTAVDIDKIERIILNLLSNAIKFSHAGAKISVNISSRNDRVFISIKDTGPGIPQDMQCKIFERFKQVGSSLTREFEGSGIGLSLVKSFVELHNGSVRVISQEDQGSEFIVELPVRQTDPSDCSQTSDQGKKSRIIEAINIELSDIYSIAS